MIVTLSPDYSSQTFSSVYILITDINFIVCHCNFADPNGVYVSSSVLSHCSIKHDDDDDDDRLLVSHRPNFAGNGFDLR